MIVHAIVRASARVSAIQNAATAARQRERRARRHARRRRRRQGETRRWPRRTFASPSWASTRVARRRRTPAAELSPPTDSDGRRSGVFPAPARARPASARKPTENRNRSPRIEAARALGTARGLARPASADVPRRTESVAAVGASATPRGAAAFARGASRNTWRRPSPSRRASRGARRALSARGSKNRDGWRPRARARAKLAPARSRVRRRVSRRRLTSRASERPASAAPANGRG